MIPDPVDRPARPALDALRGMVRRLEGGGRAAGVARRFGLAPLEAALPEGGLRPGALHEITAAADDAAAAEAFAATLLAGLAPRGAVLWCRPSTELYGPGLARLGLAPERLILVRAPRLPDLLWAMEEGLQRPGLAAVIGQPASLDLTAGRRLQLAAEGSGTLCVVLTDAAMAGAGVATTRWRVAAAPSGPAFAADARDFGLARARWQVTLTRCRGAVPAVGETDFGCWLVEEGGPATSPVARPVTAAAADIARSRAG